MQKRGRGTICLKGIATDGFQISVVRVADRAVREVKKIADRFIGELNNAESRNALKQMIVATFTQMERDGALVPSVDGSSPAFEVDVYASQNDVAAGNARIDIAVRPVRAIDYIYATIRVRN
jgi:phage tail sheath protein FI